jgi:hypothetical protein
MHNEIDSRYRGCSITTRWREVPTSGKSGCHLCKASFTVDPEDVGDGSWPRGFDFVDPDGVSIGRLSWYAICSRLVFKCPRSM